ncbi:hypothetical protein KQ236_11900 [Lactococcus lactis]|nr:hypothetical protein [Lactococcus lactis]
MKTILDDKIKNLSLNKNEFQLKMDLYSALIPYLLSTEKFKRNSEIKNFTNRLKLKRELKDYLFASRTQIVARMVREIENFDEFLLKENIRVFKEYNLMEHNETSSDIKTEKVGKKLGAEDRILKTINKYSRNKDR